MQVGMKGSGIHIFTNKNMEKGDKKACCKEICKESAKDILKLTAGVAGAAGAGAAATKSNRVVNALKNFKHSVGDVLTKADIGDTNLKEVIKGSEIYKKLNKLPLPAKAALAAGAAALAVGKVVIKAARIPRAAYIEGKHENQSLNKSENSNFSGQATFLNAGSQTLNISEKYNLSKQQKGCVA